MIVIKINKTSSIQIELFMCFMFYYFPLNDFTFLFHYFFLCCTFINDILKIRDFR